MKIYDSILLLISYSACLQHRHSLSNGVGNDENFFSSVYIFHYANKQFDSLMMIVKINFIMLRALYLQS